MHGLTTVHKLSLRVTLSTAMLLTRRPRRSQPILRARQFRSLTSTSTEPSSSSLIASRGARSAPHPYSAATLLVALCKGLEFASVPRAVQNGARGPASQTLGPHACSSSRVSFLYSRTTDEAYSCALFSFLISSWFRLLFDMGRRRWHRAANALHPRGSVPSCRGRGPHFQSPSRHRFRRDS